VEVDLSSGFRAWCIRTASYDYGHSPQEVLFPDCRYLLGFDGKAEHMRILIAEDDVALAGFCPQRSEAEQLCRGRIPKSKEVSQVFEKLLHSQTVVAFTVIFRFGEFPAALIQNRNENY
jgi:hypothetical protein